METCRRFLIQEEMCRFSPSPRRAGCLSSTSCLEVPVVFQCLSLSAHAGCCNQTPSTGDNTCSHSSGGWKAKIKVLADSESGEVNFLVHRRLSSHCVLTWQWGLGALWSFLHKGMNPIYEASTLLTSHLPKTHLQIPSHVRVRFQPLILYINSLPSRKQFT